ncbi:hypothetical protein [Aminobacter ciceronei]|uniref:Restriction alleviation protein Lar n=1 Tax=Aminobacter ciceronei TaxID=150723 RepID=A0ABR6C0Z4_9HYPH|nr:hypothetical protein [Aminobacter ciceronei]MBA8904850.1 hypothetical protein [Aminobacter ciceronei]MBA9018596.1 hypothetical protein [Aminobacter ciceronei]
MSALDKTGLEPCPFCGGKDLVSEGDDKIVGYRCRTCEATGPNHYNSRFDWNRRASTTSAGVTEEQVDHALDAADYCRNTITRKWMRAALEAAFVSRVAPVSQKEAVPVNDELWALCYLHDWGPPREGQEHRWEPGKNIFPAVHAFYTSWQDAEAIRKDMTNPAKYWVVRARTEDARMNKVRASSPSPAPAVEPVGIKALEWNENRTAKSIGGSYHIATGSFLMWVPAAMHDFGFYADDEAAIRAANRNHERSIRSALHPSPTPVSDETCATCQGNGEIVTDWETYLHGDDDEHATAECPDCNGEGKISPTPVSAPVGVVEELHELVELVADQCLGPSTLDDPDDETVGWDGDGKPLAMTFGHIRRARKAVASLRSPAVEGK